MDHCAEVLKWSRVDQIDFSSSLMQHYAINQISSSVSSDSNSAFGLGIDIPDLIGLNLTDRQKRSAYSRLSEFSSQYDLSIHEDFLMSSYQSAEAIKAWAECVSKSPYRFFLRDEGGDQYVATIGFGLAGDEPVTGVKLTHGPGVQILGTVDSTLIGDTEVAIVQNTDKPVPLVWTFKRSKTGPSVNRVLMVPPKLPKLVHSSAESPIGLDTNNINLEMKTYRGKSEAMLLVFLDTTGGSQPSPYWAISGGLQAKIEDRNGNIRTENLISFKSRNGNSQQFGQVVIQPGEQASIEGVVGMDCDGAAGKVFAILTNNLP